MYVIVIHFYLPMTDMTRISILVYIEVSPISNVVALLVVLLISYLRRPRYRVVGQIHLDVTEVDECTQFSSTNDGEASSDTIAHDV